MLLGLKIVVWTRSNVFLQVIQNAQLMRGCHVYFDNLFISFQLLHELSNKVLGGTGTVRQNRLGKAPIIEKKSLEKNL